MKRASLLVCIIICLVFVACKKGKRYSIWNINGEKFSTNEVEEVEGKAQSALSTISKENGFSITTMYFDGGKKYIGCGPNPSDVCIGFYYHGKAYIAKTASPAPVIIISGADKNGKSTFSLAPTWFVNRASANDTVLISATLSEP